LWYLQYQKQNKMRTEAMKESLQWSCWCLDGVDNDSRQKLQWPKLVGTKKSVSQQHSIKIDSSHSSSSMEQRKSGMLLIAQQSLQQVVEDEERNNTKCMETVPEIEFVDSAMISVKRNPLTIISARSSVAKLLLETRSRGETAVWLPIWSPSIEQ
jgi:hypothetical protein